MKLKDVRKHMMNEVMHLLRHQGPLTHEQLLRIVWPAFYPLNEATVSAALQARLDELVERNFVRPLRNVTGYYCPSDRMFDETGDCWIGHKLIDPEWPPYYGKEPKT